MNLAEFKMNWRGDPEYHKNIHESFIANVNASPRLCANRDYIEKNVWGFGERSFWWLWKLICDELPKNPNMLEIGVFRGGNLSLWRLLCNDAFIAGITPLSSEGGYWDSDYDADIKKIHHDMGLHQPVIVQAYSNDETAIEWAKDKIWDVIYVDGSHTFKDALFDLNTYTPMIKTGGYLIIDDCNTEMNMPFGFFQGHQEVTDAKLEWLRSIPPFEFICSVVHISVFKRI